MEKSFNSLFQVTVDEKGRFSFPSRLMNQLEGEREVFVTRGRSENCLWLMKKTYWEQFVQRISSNASPFEEESLALMRYFIGHAFEQEIEEKTRRIAIPQTLLNLASITEQCVIVGMVKFFELWNPSIFETCLERESEIREKRVSELGGLIKF